MQGRPGVGIRVRIGRRIIALGLAALLAGCHYSVVKRIDLWRKKLRLHTPASYSPMSLDEMIAFAAGMSV